MADTPTTREPTSPSSGRSPGPAPVAEVNPVHLPDWMRSPAVEHQPTGFDRLRFFSARHNGALLLGVSLAVALLMVIGFAIMVGWVAHGVRAATTPCATPGSAAPVDAAGASASTPGPTPC
ncbi:hypothetical protein ABZS77_16810 [Micromonospora sp. NPDC005298]|uniref:hypothetical protein n=1 Tax=Micromonospora sp. NPDC005298 TaxID=3156873 RepID=UPI0033B3B286